MSLAGMGKGRIGEGQQTSSGGSCTASRPGWLKIDPTSNRRRKNLRFQKLIAGAK